MAIDTNHQPALKEDSFASDLRGFGLTGILAILIILFAGNIFLGNIMIPAGALLVLLWVRLSGTPWRALGYTKPKSWVVTILSAIVLGIAFKFLMKAIVMPLFGADPINQAYHYLAGNRQMIPATLWAMIIVGFAEETVFRGFTFERLGKIFGPGIYSKIFIVWFTSIWFGLAHYSTQGIAGVEQAIIVGLVFGSIFTITQNIWLILIAHSAFDLTAYWMIYCNLETKVAHLVFQ